MLRPRGRRRATAAVLPHGSRSSFVPCEALVAASTQAAAENTLTHRMAQGRAAVASSGVLVGRASSGLPTRRAARAAAAAAARPAGRPVAAARLARAARPAVAGRTPAADRTPAARLGVARRLGGVVKKVSVVAALIGFAASGTLPLFASAGDEAVAAASGQHPDARVGSQQFAVDPSVVADSVSRDEYSATSIVDLQTQKVLNTAAAADSEWDGRTTASYLADPLYDTLDRDLVLAVATQYIGTPYVHGGEDPTKFDCSGLITFVYAQFGIKLTHYVPTQDSEGTRVSAADAVPGDLVVFDNLAHDGIYAGNGMILDAPKPGGFVSVRPIWDSPHHFVRIGA